MQAIATWRELLDHGAVWPQSSDEDPVQALADAVEERCRRAQAAGLSVSPSRYMAFVQRIVAQHRQSSQQSLARAG